MVTVIVTLVPIPGGGLSSCLQNSDWEYTGMGQDLETAPDLIRNPPRTTWNSTSRSFTPGTCVSVGFFFAQQEEFDSIIQDPACVAWLSAPWTQGMDSAHELHVGTKRCFGCGLLQRPRFEGAFLISKILVHRSHWFLIRPEMTNLKHLRNSNLYFNQQAFVGCNMVSGRERAVGSKPVIHSHSHQEPLLEEPR